MEIIELTTLGNMVREYLNEEPQVTYLDEVISTMYRHMYQTGERDPLYPIGLIKYTIIDGDTVVENIDGVFHEIARQK